MSKNDFSTLITPGNIGFYQSCEVTQLFLLRKADSAIINFYLLASFEEKPYNGLNHQFLSPKPIKVNDDYELGIQRYWLSLKDAENRFDDLLNNGSWDYQGNNNLLLGGLKPLRKQFIPAKDYQRLNYGLKNNFHNGSYLLEFFDESKRQLDFILSLNELPKLNIISNKIKQYVPFDLSIVRDRIGNIVFQFPNSDMFIFIMVKIKAKNEKKFANKK